MKSDPFAPVNDPRHIRNIRAQANGGQPPGPLASRFAELVQVHLTDHEQQANQEPELQELERRQTLVDEYLEQIAQEGPDAEAPTLEDTTGHLYAWREGDRTEDDPDEPSGQPDGETSSGWYFAGEPEEGDPAGSLGIPPRNGPGSDTESWRAFAAGVTLTEPSEWATMTRTEIIKHLEDNMVIPGEQA